MSQSVLPRITLVVPCYNAAATIERTLQSVMRQDYPNLQLIVIDGGSADGTSEILRRYEPFISYWTSEKDRGQVDALNKGFARADGEFCGWLCADDELLDGALRRLVEEFQAHPEADLITGGCRRIFNGNATVETTPDPAFFADLDFKNTIEQPSTLWRRHSQVAAGLLDESYKYAFDWEYWCRMKRCGAIFHSIPTPLSVYHFSSDNLTSTGGRKIVDEMYRVIKAYGPKGGMVADAYFFLYRTFDLRGYYDKESRDRLAAWQKMLLYLVLRILYRIYGSRAINSYNWNFASRQERGLGW